MPIEDYSHMVMENKHMMDRDGGSDDGDEEALKIALSGVESRILRPPKNEDRNGDSTLDLVKLFPYGNRVFSHTYSGIRQTRGETDHPGPNEPRWRGLLCLPRHLV
jgi:hypothetical protein